MACFVVVVVVVVAVFVVVWANDNRGLARWLRLFTLGSFQTPRQEILPTIAAVNWPIFWKEDKEKSFVGLLLFLHKQGCIEYKPGGICGGGGGVVGMGGNAPLEPRQHCCVEPDVGQPQR